MLGFGYLFNPQYGKNWIYITLRILIVIGVSVALYTANPRPITGFASLEDIIVPAIVGIIGAAAVGGLVLIKQLRLYVPLVIMPADWLLIVAYIFYTPSDNLLLLQGVISIVMLNGVLRVGAILGVGEVIGIFVASIIALWIAPNYIITDILEAPLGYLPLVSFTILFSILTIVWHNTIDEENHVNRKEVREEIAEAKLRVANMQERTRAFADMAAALNSSLNYDRILDAMMDIGRLSIKQDPKERVISIALMVQDGEDLAVAAARGLNHTDEKRTFKAQSGIVAEAIDSGEPSVTYDGESDPELKRLNAFINVRTTLAIPLRANYEVYGVLIFASTGADALNDDHFDTLSALGYQATIALRNTVLYTNLQEEKERMVRIEKNGRASLVRDLHDVPTQTISAIAMHLSILPKIAKKDPVRFEDEVENLREMAVRAGDEIRHVMFTLRPLSLEQSGLHLALRQLADKMEHSYKQPMEINVDERVEIMLDQDQQSTLFYLVEEAANNARKYAEASLIQVRVTIINDAAMVYVRDNGRGFDTDIIDNNYDKRGSFGMVNMRERAELIGGELTIESLPNRGTMVTVRVPLKDEHKTPPEKRALMPRHPLQRKVKKEYTGPLSPVK